MLQYKVLDKMCEPKRMRKGDAAFDLCARESVSIPPLGSVKVPLGLCIKLQPGTFGLLTHRSSLAFGKEVTASLGIIDENFTQEIHCKLFSHNQNYEVHIAKGDRVCQMIVQKYLTPEMEEVDEMPSGKDTKAGFGSSGVN